MKTLKRVHIKKKKQTLTKTIHGVRTVPSQRGTKGHHYNGREDLNCLCPCRDDRASEAFSQLHFLTEDETELVQKENSKLSASGPRLPFNMAFCTIYINEKLKQTKRTLVKLPFLLQLYWIV